MACHFNSYTDHINILGKYYKKQMKSSVSDNMMD